ncbi:MAG: glycosyltransferase [Ilumatobacteraceae bacterium]
MRIAIVCGICIRFDAISSAVASQAAILAELDDVDDVVIVAQYHDRPCASRQVTVTDPWQLVRHPDIVAADLVIFHWGIEYALFDALPLIAERRRAIVHFHNVTPAEFVDITERTRIERSIIQMQLPMLSSTALWTESEFNVETLLSWGFRNTDITLMPIPVESRRATMSDKSLADGVQLLTIGRLVPAKGLGVLIDAMALAIDQFDGRMTLEIAGSASSRNLPYVEDLERARERLGLADVIEFVIDPPDVQVEAMLARSHVLISPSLHEGLCVPVIEAYRASCRVVATDAGNLPFLVHPPDRIVPVLDHVSLAGAIVETAREVMNGPTSMSDTVRDVISMYSEGNVRVQLRAALDAFA